MSILYHASGPSSYDPCPSEPQPDLNLANSLRLVSRVPTIRMPHLVITGTVQLFGTHLWDKTCYNLYPWWSLSAIGSTLCHLKFSTIWTPKRTYKIETQQSQKVYSMLSYYKHICNRDKGSAAPRSYICQILYQAFQNSFHNPKMRNR